MAGADMSKGKVVESEQTANVRLLGVNKAEAIYGVSRWTLRRWAYDGKIASIKLGRRLLIPVAELERLVAEGTRPALEQQ